MGALADREHVNALLRKVRHWGYRLLDPLDHLFLATNGLAQYPPISLRRYVSRLGFVDGAGDEFYAYLRLLAGLTDASRVLDLGCGCGLLELSLEKNGWTGDLVGVDIHGPSVRWCQRRISTRVPSFRFMHADIYNAAYWRTGQHDARTWLAQFDETGFDCLVAKSLFTHMLPDELDVYLSDIPKRLHPGGKALLTAFLLDDEQDRLQSAGRSSLTFSRPSPDSRHAVRSLAAPTAAVAYDAGFLLDRLRSNGLDPADGVHYGTWSGRPDALSYQDIIVAVRR